MLVTFRSAAWSNITLFGDVAVTLLKMAGHSGTVPGAWRAADTAATLAQLKQALADAGPGDDSRTAMQAQAEDTDTPRPVPLRLRAGPLLQMLAAAAQQDCDVLWDHGAPPL